VFEAVIILLREVYYDKNVMEKPERMCKKDGNKKYLNFRRKDGFGVELTVNEDEMMKE